MRAFVLAQRRTFGWKHIQIPILQDFRVLKSHRIIRGYLIRLGGCPIIWRSKLQTLIAVSTMEAEYIAISMCMRELIQLKRIFVDLSNCF